MSAFHIPCMYRRDWSIKGKFGRVIGSQVAQVSYKVPQESFLTTAPAGLVRYTGKWRVGRPAHGRAVRAHSKLKSSLSSLHYHHIPPPCPYVALAHFLHYVSPLTAVWCLWCCACCTRWCSPCWYIVCLAAVWCRDYVWFPVSFCFCLCSIYVLWFF